MVSNWAELDKEKKEYQQYLPVRKRKSKMADEKKTPMTLLSLTEEERAMLKKLAARDGCTMTALVRRALELYSKVGIAGGSDN